MDRDQRGVAKIYQTLARIEDENRNFEYKVRKLEFFKDLRLVRKFLRYLLFHSLFPYMNSFHICILSIYELFPLLQIPTIVICC